MPSARMVGVGAFVIGGVLLFAIALFMIGERRMLFVKQFDVYTEFGRLSGLQEGATVQVSGMGAGEVKEIVIPTKPGSKFRVRLRIREDLHPLVRTDSIASIRTEGLVGSQFVLVTAGSEAAPQAPGGSTIPGREPFDFADLLDQASTTVKTVTETIVTLRGDIESAIANITGTVQDVHQLVADVGVQITSVATSGAKVADDIQSVTAGVREGRGTIGQLFANHELSKRPTSVPADAERAAADIRAASASARRLIDQWSTKGGPGEGLATELRGTLGKANQTLSNLAENTEALKHNWFFSGYFKRRGYYSLSDISPEEYRRGAIEQSGRVKLRIWLDSAVMFGSGADGRLFLLDTAKPRIDSAMADFLQYAGSTPVIVEGYAQAGATAQRFLASRDRAALVRDYLVERFALSPERVGVMPLGAEADGSPSGKTWDGVAIAVFLTPEAAKQTRQGKRQP